MICPAVWTGDLYLLSVIESDFFIDVNVFYAHNKVYLMSTGKSRAVSDAAVDLDLWIKSCYGKQVEAGDKNSGTDEDHAR